MKPYPNLKAHLDKFIQVITSDNKPYGLHRAREEQFLCQEQLDRAISDSDKKFLQQRVDTLDRQINTVVYGLYGRRRMRDCGGEVRI